MGVINFNGLISPTLFTSFQSRKATGAHRTADATYTYFLQNDAVFEFRLEVQTSAGVVTIERHASAKNPLYDKTRPCYICDETPADALEKIAASVQFPSKTAPAAFKSLKVWLKPFFPELLKAMTREDAGTNTLARPDPASEQAMLASFNHAFKGDVGIVSHPADKAVEIKEIPAEVSGVTVFPPAAAGQPPRVALSVIMRLEKLSPNDRDEVVRTFIAADYTKIYKLGKTKGRTAWFDNLNVTPTGDEVQLRHFEKNVAHYLWNHTDFNRGDAILKSLVASGANAITAGKPLPKVIEAVRNAIDSQLITANHWGQRREDRVTETYQRKLSDVLGAIHQAQFYMASPVAWIRYLKSPAGQTAFLGLTAPQGGSLGLTFEERVALILQWGVGHCGEHADVSFAVLNALQKAGHLAKIGTIIHSGNANVDHAFVVGGFRVEKVIETKLTKNFFEDAKKDPRFVFDLRAALAKAGVDGFVLDPYLAPTEIPATCKELLARLNAADRAQRRLRDGTVVDARTDFLSFVEQIPTTPPAAESIEFGLRGL